MFFLCFENEFNFFFNYCRKILLISCSNGTNVKVLAVIASETWRNMMIDHNHRTNNDDYHDDNHDDNDNDEFDRFAWCQ